MHQRLELHTKSDELLYISESILDGSVYTSPHSHPNLEILFFLSGAGTIITQTDKYKVEEGYISIINSNTTHYEIGEGLNFFALGIKDTNIFKSDDIKNSIIIKGLTSSEKDELRSLYKTIYRNSQIQDSESSIIINSSYAIIKSILKRSFYISNAKESDSYIVSNVKNILDNYYSSNIKLDDLSLRLNTSVSNICHLFKEKTGKTIIEYKIEKQLEEALNLLKVSDMSVVEISSFIGFNSSSYFIKKFKEKYKVSPKQYKKEG